MFSNFETLFAALSTWTESLPRFWNPFHKIPDWAWFTYHAWLSRVGTYTCEYYYWNRWVLPSAIAFSWLMCQIFAHCVVLIAFLFAIFNIFILRRAISVFFSFKSVTYHSNCSLWFHEDKPIRFLIAKKNQLHGEDSVSEVNFQKCCDILSFMNMEV